MAPQRDLGSGSTQWYYLLVVPLTSFYLFASVFLNTQPSARGGIVADSSIIFNATAATNSSSAAAETEWESSGSSIEAIDTIIAEVSQDFNLCHANKPKPVCKLSSCQQKDPPGVPRLQGHRGLTEMIQWRGCMLAYLLIPKSGSTTVRNTLRNNAPKFEMIRLTPNDNKYNPYTFTFLRDPGERIASAYSTIMARFQGNFVHRAPNNNHYFPRRPSDITDIPAWTEHFKQSIHLLMSTVQEVGWDDTQWVWNEHVPPQTEFMRGVNFAYIGCIESMEEALIGLGLNTTLPPDESNAYQHNCNMPVEKFGFFDVLDEETKALIREVYREDYDLYESICKK